MTIVAAPDIVGLYERGIFAHEQVQSAQFALVVHAECNHRVAVLDTPPGLAPQVAREWVRDQARWDSRAAAVYYPWLKVFDPSAGGYISIPPTGHVAGTWARNDEERGVWAVPANLPLRGALDLQQHVTEDERRELEKARINVIVARGGQGIRVWGSRTLSSNSSLAEIATTRSVAALGSFIRELTSWAANRAERGEDVEPPTERRRGRARHALAEGRLRWGNRRRRLLRARRRRGERPGVDLPQAGSASSSASRSGCRASSSACRSSSRVERSHSTATDGPGRLRSGARR